MACESFTLIDKDGNEVKLSDYGLSIGSNSGGLPIEDFLSGQDNVAVSGIIRKDGSIFQSQSFSNRTIEFPVYFSNLTEEEINDMKGKMYVRTPKKLIYDRHPYRYIWVVSNGAIDHTYIWGDEFIFTGFFTVRYIAHDPMWYSVFDSETLPAYLEDLSLSPSYEQLYYELGLPYAEDLPASTYTNVTSDGNIVLHNYGNYDSKLLIEFDGSCTDLTLTNLDNDNQSFTISSLSNEVLYVDGNRGQIRNDTELKTNLFDGDFIKLVSGQNTIQLSSTSVNLDSIKFVYRYTYL